MAEIAAWGGKVIAGIIIILVVAVLINAILRSFPELGLGIYLIPILGAVAAVVLMYAKRG